MTGPAALPPLPDGSHLLHVGPQKTGSTSLQKALHRSRDRLAALGVRYPGPDSKPEGDFGMRPDPGDSRRVPSDAPAWTALREQVHAPGDHRVVVVSLEAFGRADDEGARRVVSEIGGPGPHVVAAARRHDLLMPSQWQQRVKAAGLRLDYESWLRLVLGPDRPDDPEWRATWLPHDTAALVRRWAAAAGAVTLVVPGRDRTLLPGAVAALLGVPVALATETDVRNESISWPAAELVRLTSQRLADAGLDEELRAELVREGLARALARSDDGRADAPAVPPPPRWAHERLVELGEGRVDAVRRAVDEVGARVVGDVGDLAVPAPGDDVPEALPEVGDVPLAMATVAVDAMVRAALRREKRLRGTATVTSGRTGPGRA